ncbi:response regulator [Maribius pontilimi]|uniref:Response regulator n=1 Tax=Palleronia pontilimi TaxID=1964209 RepID=A0A934IIR7_9RHOB|nr:response regulator [Palleronia pontilimi]MBJ3762674.1 response regulator [Palleronia pontilimi]
MTDILDEFLFPRRPTAERPLLGQTILVVEDSRYAGETMRLMCLRGGARIRRADSLRAAARHLSTYRPSVILVDLGLPDGSGLDLIRQLSGSIPRVPVLMALSGDPSNRAEALKAGADDFMEKPFGSVAQFHAAILNRLPADKQPSGLRSVSDESVEAGDAALIDDYSLIGDLLDSQDDTQSLRYAISFTSNLARSTGDAELLSAADALRIKGLTDARGCAALAGLVQKRLSQSAIAI